MTIIQRSLIAIHHFVTYKFSVDDRSCCYKTVFIRNEKGRGDAKLGQILIFSANIIDLHLVCNKYKQAGKVH